MSSSLIPRRYTALCMLACLSVAACHNNQTPALTLSGTVSGLAANGLVLADGGSTIAVNAGSSNFSFGSILGSGQSYAVKVQTQPSGETCTVANGSGTAVNANVGNVVVTCATQSFHLGGTISGLTGSGLVLMDGSDSLTVPADYTSFVFPTTVALGSSYNVVVNTQPQGEACSVTNGSGTMPAADVTSVTVSCTEQPFTLGGTITGLSTSGLLLANGSDVLSVNANASSFTMPTAVNFGTSYSLTVQQQPVGLMCSFSSGVGITPSSGTMPASNVTTTALVCSPQSYALGGSVSGLTSGTLVLANGTDTVSITGNGSFQFPTSVAYGASYSVTVQTAPSGLTCTVSNGSNTMPAQDVTNVSVLCGPTTYTIGGSISNLTGSGLVLANGSDTLSVAANANSFTMPTAQTSGSTYNVTITTQPSNQLCQVSNGNGTVGSADVTNIQVSCQNWVSYTTPGSYTWVVPAGVSSLSVVATGGGGGGGFGFGPNSSGGNAAQVTSTLSVAAGDTVTIYVSGGGTINNGAQSHEGGGGGGLSYVGDATTASFVIAGGGGGGGGGPTMGGTDANGGDAGSPGGDGLNSTGGGAGSGGTGGAAGSGGQNAATTGGNFSDLVTTGSGSGGTGGGCCTASAGGTGISSTIGNGGTGGEGYGGGGGGGGYGGGGGGGDGINGSSSGGGGGGSFGPTGVTSITVVASGAGAGGINNTAGHDGSVVITW